MKSGRLTWVFTAWGDDLGLEQRLNQLAEQGWEWVPPGDGGCYLARLRPTRRRELRYFVEAAPLLRSQSQLRCLVERRTAQGWEALATVNGLDLYRSAPCRTPEPPERSRPRGPWLCSAALALAAALLCLLWPRPGAEWMLSDLSALLFLSRFVVTPIALLWAAWRLFRALRPTRRAAPVLVILLRGVLAALFRLWLLLLGFSIVLTLLPRPLAFGLLGLALLFRLGAGLVREDPEGPIRWRPRSDLRLTACCLGAVLLLAIGLNQLGVTNAVHRFGTQLEEARRFVRTEELDPDAGAILSAEYRCSASLLAERESYTETTELLRLDCERWRVPLPLLRSTVQKRLEQRCGENCVLVTQGDTLLLLNSSAPLSENARIVLESRLDEQN